MAKTVSASLDSHLDEEVTTLATLWRITRTDGQEFFFTDHDADIVFGGNTYKADSGYKRTAIQNDSSLSVDNLDVEGVFDNSAITEQDLRAGLFDYAQVRISIVNWDDLTQGEIKMRNGRLGEVLITVQDIFRAELRGMSQQFSRRIGKLYQPECRADLGDSECNVPIQPNVRANSTAYSVGDFVRVATNGTGDLSPAIRLLVPADSDANDNSRYGATATVGAEAAVQGVVTKFGAGAIELSPTATVDPSTAFVSYPDSANYILGSSDFTLEGHVRFKSLTATEQVLASHYLNTGNQRGWFLSRNGSTLRAHIFSDGSSTLLDMSVAFTWAIDTWYHIALTRSGSTWRLFVDGTLLGTATAAGSVHDSTEVLRLGKLRSAGSDDLPLNGFLDDWKFYIGDALYVADFTAPVAAHALAPGSAQQSAYENRIYECTWAGTSGASAPTMDETPGNTTQDGWTAAQAVLTVSANPGNTETVTTGSTTYTFVNSLSSANDVLIGASASDTLDNLVSAVNGTAGEGSTYGTGTTANTEAMGERTDTQEFTATAILPATNAGNDIVSTETLANGSWDDTTFSSGVAGLVWTARQAWTRHAWIETVTDATQFTLYSTGYAESRDVDDWYNGGALAFEDGDNNNRIVEIRDWDQSSRQVTLFLPASYEIGPGTAVRLYPGCDKRIGTCSSKFTISGSTNFDSGNAKNFRGEPHVPGQDVITSYPDAK